MRNRIIYSLMVLFALFMIGAGITMLYLYKTTSNLESVINLHRIEIIRQDLVINAQTVQTHLFTMGTVFGAELDVIVENVLDLDSSVRNCLGCHHTQEITSRLTELVDAVEQYQEALSYLLTTSANPERMERLRLVTIDIGTNLLKKSQEMAFIAGQKLNARTFGALREINNSRLILVVTLVLSFFIALTIAVTMTRQVTEPITELVDATRRIKSGELGYTTAYEGKAEFGELISSFNDMSRSLDDSNRKIMAHLHSLANLYTVTLTFHSITNRSDIYRELSRGVSELVGAEQCGLMLPNGEHFRHMFPAAGLDEGSCETLRLDMAAIAKLPTNRRALILNDGIEGSPMAEADKALGVKNLMLVWVRHKGQLAGIIRVANKRSGDFTDDDVRPLSILANNVSVALENARLYEDLRKQMMELKDTQEQLLQAAKLAAIGELASNVAHEINNPLTSVLGYAELIKEETDMAAILKDIEVIEKEALRAREIVHQLLEFSRKRALAIKELDVNGLLEEVINLISLQIRDMRIEVARNFGVIPAIQGDANQLKQVFLNLINNAVDAMSNEGTLGITSYADVSHVYVAISDTGKGMPKEIMSRIFEPFFTTKKDKGTGIGLSVSYKIIQSHNGRIDVQSEIDKGSTFTVVLPITRSSS